MPETLVGDTHGNLINKKETSIKCALLMIDKR